jgi:chaperonin GroES
MKGACAQMKLKPLGDKVVIKRTEAETTTQGGIVLPDSATEKPRKGKILSVGDGKLLKDGTRKPLAVKKGDTVLFSSYGGTEIKVDGNEVLIMEESDILAILG